MEDASAENEPAVDAIARLTPAILRALHALEFAGRHLSPATLPQLIDALAGRDDDLGPAFAASRALAWPERLGPVRDCLERAAEAAGEGIAGFRIAAEAPQPMLAAYRALRSYARAAEALYPMAAFLRPVSQFFLEPGARDDAALAAQLAAVDPHGAYRRAAWHARRLLALCAGVLRRDARLAVGCGTAWRQWQRRRLPMELAARGALARLRCHRADGHWLDLVADGAGRGRG